MFSLFSKPGKLVSKIKEKLHISKKRALVIGLNYYTFKQQSNNLHESQQIFQALKLGAYITDIKLINDLPNKLVTKAEIIEQLQWLVNNAEKGDILVLHFSGLSSEYPIVINSTEHISIEEINSFIFDVLPSGVTFLFTMNSMFTGFGLRYKYEKRKLYENMLIPTTEFCCIVIINSKKDSSFIKDLVLSLTRESHLFKLNMFSDAILIEFGQVLDVLVPMSRLVGSPI
jgi:hypothetical protein